MRQVDFILYEFQRRAKQKEEESMFRKIKGAEPTNPTPKENMGKLQNNNTTPLVVM